MKKVFLLLVSFVFFSPQVFADEARGTAVQISVREERIREAMPGEALYREKRRREAEHLRDESDPLKRSELHAEHAGKRLAEAENMFAAGEHRTAGNLLRDYERSFNLAVGGIESGIARGRDVSRHLEALERSAGRNTEVLTQLLAEVPEQARPGIGRAIEVSRRGRNRAAEARGRIERGEMPPGRRDEMRPEASDRRVPPGRRPPPVSPGIPGIPEDPGTREVPDSPETPEPPGPLERPERPGAPGDTRGPGDIRGPGAPGRP